MEQLFVRMFVVVQTGLHDLRASRKDGEGGATAVEYGLIVSLIAGAIVLAVTALGVTVHGLYAAVTAVMP